MRRCDLPPLSPEFAPLVVRADARAVGALSGRDDLSAVLSKYETARDWTWEMMTRRGVALARSAPDPSATPQDVMRITAELFRTVPALRDECGSCRACADAKGIEKGAHEFAHAVRQVWYALTGRSE
jgi:hypothetical protein